MAAKKEDMFQGKTVPVRSGGGVTTLRDEVDRLFDRFGMGRRRTDLAPDLWNWDPFAGMQWQGVGRTDLSETETGYELEVDLPGMKKDDVEVDLSNGVLTISGKRSDEREDKRKGYYLSERSYGSFQRSFRIPEGVETDKIKAEFKDGVLTLTMPRSEEAEKSARRIEVG